MKPIMNEIRIDVGFEVLPAAAMKNVVFLMGRSLGFVKPIVSVERTASIHPEDGGDPLFRNNSLYKSHKALRLIGGHSTSNKSRIPGHRGLCNGVFSFWSACPIRFNI
jgi:hypothetical protein